MDIGTLTQEIIFEEVDRAKAKLTSYLLEGKIRSFRIDPNGKNASGAFVVMADGTEVTIGTLTE